MVTGDETFRLKKMAHLTQGCTRVLDIGWLQKPNPYLKNATVIGLDGREHTHLPQNYTRAVTGDALGLPAPFEPGSFDAIVAGEILEHFEQPIHALRAWHETLQPGGRLVLSTPNPNSPIEQLLTINLTKRFFYTEEHICLYPQRWLLRLMRRAGFQQIRLYSGGLPVPFIGLMPWPRPWCYQTIAVGKASP